MIGFAAARVGAVRLGIDIDAVVQAIPVPAAQALLPRRQGALCGVVPFEGMLVPVVDLARWVDVGAANAGPRGGARVLILRQAGRTLGLQVDSVDGLVEVPGAAIARLHHDADPDEVFHSAAQVPGSGDILSLLDVGRLAALTASWHEDDAPAAVAELAEAAAAGPEAQRGRDYALLQLDGVRLGVPAGDLAEVMAMPALERLGIGSTGGAWCRWRGRHLPVLAGGALPALPGADDAPLLAVIEHAGLVLALPVRSALALASFVAPDADAGTVTATVYDEEERQVHLLDTAALFARSPEALLSRPEADKANHAARDAGIVNTAAYIVFEAGQLAATPIAAVGQIVPLAAGAAGTAATTMPWNGAALPLLDLRPPQQAGAAGHVLVAAGDARPVGYIVSRVELLVPAGGGKLYRIGAVDFVTVAGADGEASYRIVELARASQARVTA